MARHVRGAAPEILFPTKPQHEVLRPASACNLTRLFNVRIVREIAQTLAGVPLMLALVQALATMLGRGGGARGASTALFRIARGKGQGFEASRPVQAAPVRAQSKPADAPLASGAQRLAACAAKAWHRPSNLRPAPGAGPPRLLTEVSTRGGAMLKSIRRRGLRTPSPMR